MESGFVNKEDAEGQEVEVAVTVGATVEHADLVVDPLQRPRREGALVVRQDAIRGRLERPAQTTQTAKPERASRLEPVFQQPLCMQPRRLFPQQPQFLLEQIHPMQGVVGLQKLLQTLRVVGVFFDGDAVPQEQIPSALEHLFAFRFEAILFAPAHLVEHLVHQLHDVKAVVDDEHVFGAVLLDGLEEGSRHVDGDR